MQLGIDIGTSAVKAVLCDGPHLLRAADAALDCHAAHPGWSEQDPADWWTATQSALSQLGDLSGVRAIGLSGQMHGAVLLGPDDQALRPAILWNDNRSIAECAMLEERLPDIGMRAGVRPLPGFTAPKLSWLRAQEPEIYAQIRHILLPKDYVGLCLHGGHATDVSDAAGTLWLDQQSRDWCQTLCAASDTDPGWLPDLFYGHEQCGAVTARAAALTGLPPGTPVFAGGGDAATGAVSLGITEAGKGLMSFGTSGQILVAGSRYCPNPDAYVHAFAHTIPDRWYQMAAMLNGARPLSWMAQLLGISVPQLLAEAETADPARAPIFLPYLTGERSPLGDPHIRASFALLDDATSRAELALSVVEAIAFSFGNALASFGDESRSVSHFLAIGGGSRSDFLLQKVSDLTGVEIRRPSNAASGAAMGAARLALWGETGQLSPAPEDHTACFIPRQDAALSARQSRAMAYYDKIGRGQI